MDLQRKSEAEAGQKIGREPRGSAIKAQGTGAYTHELEQTSISCIIARSETIYTQFSMTPVSMTPVRDPKHCFIEAFGGGFR